MADGLPFFDQTDTVAAITALSEAESMTLLVGAGASYESGLPIWETLLRRMLAEVAARQGLTGEDIDAFTQWTIEQDGVRGAGAVVKVALGEEFSARLREALYQGEHDRSPGPTAQMVAQLGLEMGDGSEVATTNYDSLLEDAARSELDRQQHGEGWTVRSSTSGETQGPGEFLVRHLHGVLLPDGTSEGDVVLSEADYHLMQEPGAWQEDYVGDRLRKSQCLFVGMSLSDPNLLRYLYRSGSLGSTPRHFACFVRQQEATLYDQVSDSVALAREQTAEARWAAMGIRPLRADYFSQSAQLVYEIAERRRRGSGYMSYSSRLARWDGRVSSSVLSTEPGWFEVLSTEPGWFEVVQDELQSILADVADGVRVVLAEHDIELEDGERLGCSLWVHRPRDNALVNWASSDRVWRDPETLEPVPIAWASNFASVQAFCSGSLVSFSTRGQSATRWNHVVAAPISLKGGDEYGRLPVGVVTMASTEPESSSILGRGVDVVRRVIMPAVVNRLEPLLHLGG